MYQLKAGAKIENMLPEILIGIQILDGVIQTLILKKSIPVDYVMTITEITGGKHMTGSKHYLGLGVDVRSKDMSAFAKQEFVRLARIRLTSLFYIFLEGENTKNEHFHLQYNG
jgi:hypothetical protein